MIFTLTPIITATTSGHALGMDDAYRFACALLAAREVDREAAQMICQQAKDGRISLEQAIAALQRLASAEHKIGISHQFE